MMIKFTKKVLVLFISFFLVTMGCFAGENGITVNYKISANNATVNPGKQVDITVSVSGASNKLSATDIKVNFDNTKFKYVTALKPNVPDSDMGINTKESSVIVQYADMSGTGSRSLTDGNVITLRFEAVNVSQDTTATFSYSVSAAGDTSSAYKVNQVNTNANVSIHIPSTNNNLSSLSINGVSLSPAFNKNTTKYSATTDASQVTINATSEEPVAKVQGTGEKTLNYGDNSFTVVVTSESGAVKTYAISINRPDNRSNNSSLESLNITNTKITLLKNSYSYSTTVANNISSVNVNATASDSRATITGNGAHALKVGKNSFVIKVTAENGSSTSYSITIVREDASGTAAKLSSNNNLSSLTIQNGAFNFNKDINDYTLSVPYTQSTLNINYETEDKNAVVNIMGGPELLLGNNTVVITVTAENGTAKCYNLTIIRLDDKYNVNNETSSILEGLQTENEKLTISLSEGDSGLKLNETLLKELSTSQKKLVYEWNNTNNVMLKSLTIDGNNIKDVDVTINPNLSNTINNNLLLKLVNGINYVGINTMDSNIPDGSVYKLSVDENEDIYFVYYYVDNILVTKKLSNENGYIEFDLLDNTEYAIVSNSDNVVKTNGNEKFSWLMPVLLIIIVILIVGIASVIILRKYKTKNKIKTSVQ